MKCNSCGADLELGSKFCEKCGKMVQNEDESKKVENVSTESKKEKVFLGLIGAIIGSLAGALAIIVFAQLGYVASLAGVAMAFCTLFLYEKFAGTISKKGVIISIVVMIIMTLLAENASFSLQIVKELKEAGTNVSFIKVFTNLYKLMNAGYLNNGAYFGDLAMVYLFTILGAFGVLKTKLNVLKNNN